MAQGKYAHVQYRADEKQNFGAHWGTHSGSPYSDIKEQSLTWKIWEKNQIGWGHETLEHPEKGLDRGRTQHNLVRKNVRNFEKQPSCSPKPRKYVGLSGILRQLLPEPAGPLLAPLNFSHTCVCEMSLWHHKNPFSWQRIEYQEMF